MASGLQARRAGFHDVVWRVCGEEVLADKGRGTDEPGQVADRQRPQEIHGWRRPHAQCQPEHALRRHGRHQDSRRRVVVFQVSLHDEAAQGMGDEHRVAAQVVGGGADVVDVVGHGTCVKPLSRWDWRRARAG